MLRFLSGLQGLIISISPQLIRLLVETLLNKRCNMRSSCELIIVLRDGIVVRTAFRFIPVSSEIDRVDRLVKLKYFGLASKRRFYLQIGKQPPVALYRKGRGQWEVNTSSILSTLRHDVSDRLEADDDALKSSLKQSDHYI